MRPCARGSARRRAAGSSPEPDPTGRLYLELPTGEHLSLHPLLCFRSSNLLEQVFFLNRARRGRGGSQFLCYFTGTFFFPGGDPADPVLARDVDELLDWIESRRVPTEATVAPCVRPPPPFALFPREDGDGFCEGQALAGGNHGAEKPMAAQQVVCLLPVRTPDNVVHLVAFAPGSDGGGCGVPSPAEVGYDLSGLTAP